jgi:hypothetical protein
MEKGSQGTALGLGSGGPKLTGEGRFLNVGHLDAPARRKGNGLIFPSLVVGGSGGDKARVERGSAYPLLRQRGCREGAPPRPAVQKGGNTNEVGDVRASPGGRYLFSLTGASPGIGLAGDRAHVPGKAPRLCGCPVRSRGSMKTQRSVGICFGRFLCSRR